MATVQQLDEVIEKYYNYHGQEYDQEFASFCEDNGYDTDMIAEELADDNNDDGDLTAFDDSFPVPILVKQDNKPPYIFGKLKLFYTNPNITFPKKTVVIL